MSLQVALRNPNTVSTYVAPTSAQFVRSIYIKKIKGLTDRVSRFSINALKPNQPEQIVYKGLGYNTRKFLKKNGHLVVLFKDTKVKCHTK